MSNRTHAQMIAAALCLTQAGAAVQAQECETWLESFPTTELLGAPWCAVTWDDGSGPALYAGGEFSVSGGGAVALHGIGRYRAGIWESIDGGMAVDGSEPEVRALVVFDDGGGEALYAGGGFETAGGVEVNSIARWDGENWSGLAGGLTQSDGAPGFCWSATVFEGQLFVWGAFDFAGGVAADGFACWDGANWVALNNNLQNGSSTAVIVYDLEVYDDGHGPAIYAGGRINASYGHMTTGVAKWEVDSWEPLGVPLPLLNFEDVRDLHVADLGAGARLYVGGEFRTSINGYDTQAVAAWDGQAWHNLELGLENEGSGGAVVYGLGSYDFGDGTRLFAAGDFEARWLGAENFISWFDGWSWHPMELGTSRYATEVVAFDRGEGPRVWVLGTFDRAGHVGTPSIAAWDGSRFERASVGLLDGTTVRDLEVFDDGDGPAVFAGGWLSGTGYGTEFLARLDGEVWTPYPEVASPVEALGAFDLGAGTDLYVATEGSGTDITVARLGDGVWERVGSTLFNGGGQALGVFDAGAGAQLYCGGDLAGLWGAYSRWATTWTGSEWTPMDGLDGIVHDWAVFDDGSGEAIYAAGTFREVHGEACRGIARWNGAAWESVAGGLNGDAFALEVFDDGGGPGLYVGGQFTVQGGGGPSAGVARWTGLGFEALGDGLSGNPVVYDLRAFDDGSGMALYVGGNFAAAGGIAASDCARWTGSGWEAVGLGVGGGSGFVRALEVFDDGSGPRLAAGGTFIQYDGIPAGRVAAWDGAAWAPLGTGMNDGVWTLAVFDDGSGERLFAGGQFDLADGQPADLVAGWDGAAWHGAGSIDDRGRVYSLEVFDPGTGAVLYAGGTFTEAAGRPVGFLASWDGGGWSGAPDADDFIHSLKAMVYGDAPVLGVGGEFRLVGSDGSTGLVRLDGDRWAGVPNSPLDGTVTDLLEHDDGGGSALYLGGGFTQPGRYVARYKGSAWEPLGEGFDDWVRALEVFDDGAGAALYAAGDFTESGGTPAGRVARWDGDSWQPVGGGIDNGVVTDLEAHDGPNGPWLVALGSFTSVEGGTPSDRIAAWDGARWIPFSPGLDDYAACALSTDYGGSPRLYVGGSFGLSGGVSAGALAVWGACPPPPCVADFNDDGAVNTLDVLAFLNAWVSGDGSADINGDGDVNTLDVLAFLNLWNAGC
ncbi:MAG: hypothetical protein IT431_01755 [Phycisphaerales bacterium]|nr:hypothetical protein [Phycisphaerales bacterium]